jgi:predicted nucleic acid-binding protein
MKGYLLDTNLLIIYSRENDFSKKIEHRYKLFTGNKDLFISTVSIGELDAFIKKNDIGKRKQRKISEMLDMIDRISIEHEEIISKYGDIDAFSQGKLKIKGHHFSAMNMGKNDIWIGATASHFDLKLITTDKDFMHLNEVFLDLEYIELSSLS